MLVILSGVLMLITWHILWARLWNSIVMIKVFNTIADASKELKIPTTNISKCCKGLRKSAGNFVWKYGQL